MRLTRDDKNKVFEAIAKSSIDPAECNLQAIAYGGMVSHKSGSTFEFGYHEEMDIFWAIATVKEGFRWEIEDVSSFDDLLNIIPDWANEINHVARTPDFWEEMRRSRELITDIQRQDSGNSPFTQDEQKQIAAQLQEIKKQIRAQFELTNEQMTQVDEKLDEVVEASKRLGRKDWLIYVLGTITGVVITATVPSGLGEHIFTMVIHGLAHLFTGGDGPPRILA